MHFAAAIVCAWVLRPSHPDAPRLLALAPAPQNQVRRAGAAPDPVVEPLSDSPLAVSQDAPPSFAPPAVQADSHEPRLSSPLSDPPQRSQPRSGPRRELFTVTAYCPCPECCGNWARHRTTAAGMPVTFNRSSFAAADTRVLPFLTRVRVPGYAGGKPVPVIDRGRAVRGRHIDVFFPTHRQAERWGKKRLWIEIYP